VHRLARQVAQMAEGKCTENFDWNQITWEKNRTITFKWILTEMDLTGSGKAAIAGLNDTGDKPSIFITISFLTSSITVNCLGIMFLWTGWLFKYRSTTKIIYASLEFRWLLP
jgi:hypothetical protein